LDANIRHALRVVSRSNLYPTKRISTGEFPASIFFLTAFSMNRVLRFSSFALLAVALIGCSKKSMTLSTSNRVVEHILSDVENINPYNSSDANATYVQDQIFGRLLACNRETLLYDVPWLADSLPEESADHMRFDFRIRKGVKFADGKEMTGEDVIFSLKALKNPLNMLSGQKRTYVDAIHSCELVNGDPYHVRFIMAKPYFLVREAVFGDVLYIIPKHIFDPKGLTDKYSWDDIAAIVETGKATDLDSAKIQTIKTNPAMKQFADDFSNIETGRTRQFVQGTGPYKFDEWKTQEYVRLVRNPYYVNYWGKMGEANLDTIIYKTINDWNAAVTALKSRDIDIMGTMQPVYYGQIDTQKSPFLKKTTFYFPQYTFIGFNQSKPMFADPKVREALGLLIDRKTIIDKVLHGLATPTESPTFFKRPEFNADLPAHVFDPARAKAILDSLDWKDHDNDGILDKVIDGKRVKFEFNFLVNAGNETRKQILLIVVEAMRKIGISTDVQAIDWSIYLNRMRDHQFDAHFGAWVSDPYETDNFQLYHSSQATNRGSNYDNYKSPRADKLMEEIRAELDPPKRLLLQKELQRVFYEEKAECFLWVPMNPASWVDRYDNVSWNSYRPGYDEAWWKVRNASGGVKAANF
jgi:ABC-type transport system substrate-binding protein